MKKKNIIIIAVVAAVCIAALIVALRGSRKATFKQDYHIEDTSTITRIFLADKQDGEVLLTRVGDSTWMVDNDHLANQPMVKLFLETLNTMRIRQQVNRNAVPTVIKHLAAKGIKVEVYQRVPLIDWFGGKLRLFTREKLMIPTTMKRIPTASTMMLSIPCPQMAVMAPMRMYITARRISLKRELREYSLLFTTCPFFDIAP